jgi:hypothetical protein
MFSGCHNELNAPAWFQFPRAVEIPTPTTLPLEPILILEFPQCLQNTLLIRCRPLLGTAGKTPDSDQ